MNYLIDTHVFIWSVSDRSKLSVSVKEVFENNHNNFFVSAVSFWEIALKFSIGKLQIKNFSPEMLPELAVSAGFKIIPLLPSESASYHQLNLLNHKDPFDKMLIWQAVKQNMTFISKDRNIASYTDIGLKVLW